MKNEFSLNYAPHLGLMSPDAGMFREHAGADPVDQVNFIGDQGFSAIEDNWMAARPIETQEAIGRTLRDRGMLMGEIVNSSVYDRPTFVLDNEAERARIVQEVGETAAVARRVGARYVTTLSGTAHPSLPRDVQTANMIENLKWAGEAAGEEGLVLALEPINQRGWPGTFVTNVAHAFMISKSVSMPSVKILYDFWHQQIHAGDLLENLELAWDEIAYFQVADNPGRVEPGVGEINFGTIMRRIADKGFSGIIGMEFGPSLAGLAGEVSMLNAIHSIDPR